jgi:hypothetical protein
MRSTETYAVLRQHLAPAFKAEGFKRATSMLSWIRPQGTGHLVVWCQAAQSGWDMYSGSQFMEFQRSAAPAVGAIPSCRKRLHEMLDDEGREEIRTIQNAVIAALRQPPPMHPLLNDTDALRNWYLRKFRPVDTPYGAGDDVWLRYASEQHVAAWAAFILRRLPNCLKQAEAWPER